jgi:hypothetical protein
VPTVFVLLPRATTLDPLLAELRELAAARTTLRLRTYPPADDRKHLLSLVRAGRDPLATRWRRGMVCAIAAGAVLGLVTNGVLAGAFGMFGGLVELALPLGFVLGAFLGGFTAAMTGTEVARDEVRTLAAATTPGAVLLQVASDDPALLERLVQRCRALDLPWRQST